MTEKGEKRTLDRGTECGREVVQVEKVVQITAIRKGRAQQEGRTYKENGEGSAREGGGRLWGPSKQGPDWGRP